MLFSSQPFFFLFLPLTLAAYYVAGRRERVRLAVLIAASLSFYGWWDPRFVPLLVGLVGFNWLTAWAYLRTRWRAVIVFGVGANLAVLGGFKYADFAASSLLALVGVAHQPWNFILPLGISFFTFQQISYLVDLRRGHAVLHRPFEYAAYVMFFPQLIAGPIVRHDQLIPQFVLDPWREGLAERWSRGLLLFSLGLAKKVFFADELAPLADPVFDHAAAGDVVATADAWLGALAYSLQLYFDFSAYSDMAIGLGALFGLALPLNFASPYQAPNIREFWRRWHVTLGAFLRDYVYVPLGGSRGTLAATLAAVMVTMLLCGLWHGAGWTFVAWGALHGAAICISRVWARFEIALPWPLAWAVTMAVVVAGWVLFRAESFDAAGSLLVSMTGGQEGGSAVAPDETLTFVAIGLAVVLLGRHALAIAESALARSALVAAGSAALVVLALLRVGEGRGLEFIYFQF